MAGIPEHLLKRAQEAREKAAAEAAGASAPTAASSDAGSRIPADLLERSKAASGGVAVAEKSAAPVVGVPTNGGIPYGAGPGGHTQRLLTVVKSGSIQDVKAVPVDKVHTWPHLLGVEFVASLACTAFVFMFSWFVNAPLLQAANFNRTPNPSKAPWYFLGLQELLTMFHPMIAGVTIPGMGIIAMMFAPFLDRNESNRPEDRKFLTGLWTVHLMFWAVLVIIGSFFRGPGFNFIFPWRDGIFFEL
ncbi:MAG: menaquinol-cytochrome c reductase cytochrome b subunit [Acidimicrobiaceae bacterium]|nr:menaquinol-cytochrome c reductase cytochrome b subunit [Acidimicrobiaceae bacterium]